MAPEQRICELLATFQAKLLGAVAHKHTGGGGIFML